MDLDELQSGPKKKTPAGKQLEFHKPEIPKDIPEIIKGLSYLPSNINGMEQLFGDSGGYPLGSIFNCVGIPKVGKTTTYAYEALGWAQKGLPIWIMYNESSRERYMALWNRHRLDLGIPDKEYVKLPIQFVSAFGKRITSRPQYSIIRKMMKGWVGGPLNAYLKRGNKPAAIIFDSLTGFFREWAAQAYIFVDVVVTLLHEAFSEYNIRPVVFAISQKASKEWGKDDEQGFGGYGPVHIMDGSIVFSKKKVDSWFHKEIGLPLGSMQRFIRMDARDIYGSEDLHHYVYEKGPNSERKELWVGKSVPLMVREWEKGQSRSEQE